MYRYFIKTPWIAKFFFANYLWNIKTKEKEIYLTFDDGPHPDVTPWVLEQLKNYQAKATFFCVGNNVEKYPDLYRQLVAEGHTTGNHTFHHLNGWKVSSNLYMEDIRRAADLIHSNLFRPPYGKIKLNQEKKLAAALRHPHPKIIMWDVLSADFDVTISKEKCLENVLLNYGPGSIIVFHDSEKAYPHLKYVLPNVLEHLRQEGYICRSIECITKEPVNN
ncbi:MAG TPA: polysaccharide deacetylase family protein [Flavisolibacter sp.]|nr:polysaccharide deacetylase family protein [Flavisolibacter sp.]